MPQTLTKTQTIQNMLTRYRGQIEAALPAHLTPTRIARLAMTTCRRNPRLLDADPVSLFGAIIECSQLGLEPGRTGHLVPFRNKKRGNRLEVQMIPDYRGLMELTRRAGGVGEFYAQEVREGDQFDYQYGTGKFLHHRPGLKRGEITHVYAYAAAPDGSWNQFEVMSRAEVDEIRARSKAGDDGPWATDYAAMARKTVIKRLCKMLPSSPELSQALVLDDRHAAGLSQANRAVIDADFLHDDEEEIGAAGEDIPEPKAKADTEPKAATNGKPKDEAAPPFTAEQIAEQIREAKTQDELDLALDLIGSVEDEAARALLVTAAKDAGTRLTATAAPEGLSPGRQRVLRDKMVQARRTPDQFAQHFGCDIEALPLARFNEAVAWCKQGK